MSEFISFKKIPRLTRDCIITEKIDGTNAQIYITEEKEFFVGSRSKWITIENDNFGFAKWAEEHKEELIEGLGVGRHYGEWRGSGIQRNYGLNEKRFYLFNTIKWGDDSIRPGCCHVVPIIYEGIFKTEIADYLIDVLRLGGSLAVRGFMKPEGIVIYHKAGGYLFKKTIENDEKHKGEV